MSAVANAAALAGFVMAGAALLSGEAFVAGRIEYRRLKRRIAQREADLGFPLSYPLGTRKRQRIRTPAEAAKRWQDATLAKRRNYEQAFYAHPLEPISKQVYNPVKGTKRRWGT